jgi:hypothetical protein
MFEDLRELIREVGGVIVGLVYIAVLLTGLTVFVGAVRWFWLWIAAWIA